MWGRGKRTALLAAAVLCLGGVIVVGPAGAETTLAPDERQNRDSITIRADNEFNPANGVRSGSGTKADPFIISNWNVGRMHIADTSRYIVIRNNTVTSQLVLNWNGDRVKLVDNDINDLRVNQNVKRTGGPTSGLIANNRIGVVGQLRHFDGVFERNVVGNEDEYMDSLPFFDTRAVNFDGFNGARFRNNTIYGYMDVKLHGHHHGSGYGQQSHHHSMPKPAEDSHGDHGAEAGHGYEMVDHSQRFHEVWVTGNKIYAPGSYYALGYNDRGHAANDRTANSEENPALSKPHVHYTRVHLSNNKLFGSGLEVDIFNSEDELHKEWAMGMVEIRGNEIALTSGEAEDLFSQRNGITVWRARYLDLRVIDNIINADFSGDPTTAVWERGDSGISIDDLTQASIYLRDNAVSDTHYGIHARQMTNSVRWRIQNLDTKGVAEPIYYDNSVKNRPEQGP